MKKKGTAAVLMIALSAFLAGCQGVSVLLPYSEKNTVPAVSEETPEEPAQAAAPEPIIEPVIPEEPEIIEEIPEEEPEPVFREVDLPGNFDPGTVTGQTYENKTLGFGLTLGDDWTYLSPEELCKLNEMKEEATHDTVTAYLEEPQEYTDMDATSGGIGDEITVSAIKYLYLGTEDMNEVATACCVTIEEQLSKEKIENMTSETRQVEFLGQMLYASVVTGVLEGNQYNVIWLHDHKNGYYYSVRVMYYGEKGPDAILGNFYALEEAI